MSEERAGSGNASFKANKHNVIRAATRLGPSAPESYLLNPATAFQQLF